jgi:hypothetical protein
MSKLHELLAVSTNLENQANKTRSDLMATFDKKRHLFEQKLVTFKSNEEGVAAVTEAQSDIQSTVNKELGWIAGILSKDIDVGHQIDIANTQAKADIVTETGETIAKEVPATSLLQLEKHIQKFHELLVTVPTLDPAKGFQADDSREHGIFRAREVNKFRTKKVNKPLVLAPATDKHPAQVQLVTEDVTTGTIQEQEWSALLTPATKADLIERCEVLLRAVKKARARANELDLDVITHKIGGRLLDFVLKPLAK